MTQGEAEHVEGLKFPTGQSKTHQKKEYNGHHYANDEVFTLKELCNAKGLGVVVVQLT